MNLNEIFGKAVVDLATATTVGRVDDVIVDADERQIVGFRVGKSAKGADWLAWDSMRALGADALTIESADQLTAAPSELADRRGAHHAIGGHVLTDEGREIGPLDDVDVDAETGAVLALVAAGDRLDAEGFLGIGSYATVVRDPHGA